MPLNMQYSDTGLGITEREEALRLVAYYDVGGVITNGYGHTGSDVYPGQVITRDQAVTWLREDIQKAVESVNKSVRVTLSQNQFDALVDFVFNVGVEAFENSTMLKLLNQGNYAGADKEFLRWTHVGGVVNRGLLGRRILESNEFEEK